MGDTFERIIIAGSGRSGTSYLTSLFKKRGFWVGNDYLESDDRNPNGFFEDNRINEINQILLKQLQPTLPEIYRRLFHPHYPVENAHWLANLTDPAIIKFNVETSLKDRITSILSKHPRWCFKDPRFSYTLSAWLPYMKSSDLILVLFRDPDDVARSIVNFCRNDPYLHKMRITMKYAKSIWTSMYRSILFTYSQNPDGLNWKIISLASITKDENIIDKILSDKNGSFGDLAYKDVSKLNASEMFNFLKQLNRI